MITQVASPVHSFNGTPTDRRDHPRFALRCLTKLARKNAGSAQPWQTHAWTEDVSCDGFSCITDERFETGDVLECEMVIGDSGRSGGLNSAIMRGLVQVVRVARAGQTGFVVACRMVRYNVASSSPLKAMAAHS